jgi:hypothetical protein
LTDSFNNDAFPKNILRKGEEYVHWTRYDVGEMKDQRKKRDCLNKIEQLPLTISNQLL